MTILAGWFAVNGLFLLWIWIKYKMTNNVNTVRGFVAHCVRLIAFVDKQNIEESFDPENTLRTELLIPYGLFVANTDEQIYNAGNTVFDMAVMEFPPSDGWNITVLSSDENVYLSTVKNMKEAIS